MCPLVKGGCSGIGYGEPLYPWLCVLRFCYLQTGGLRADDEGVTHPDELCRWLLRGVNVVAREVGDSVRRAKTALGHLEITEVLPGQKIGRYFSLGTLSDP